LLLFSSPWRLLSRTLPPFLFFSKKQLGNPKKCPWFPEAPPLSHLMRLAGAPERLCRGVPQRYKSTGMRPLSFQSFACLTKKLSCLRPSRGSLEEKDDLLLTPLPLDKWSIGPLRNNPFLVFFFKDGSGRSRCLSHCFWGVSFLGKLSALPRGSFFLEFWDLASHPFPSSPYRAGVPVSRSYLGEARCRANPATSFFFSPCRVCPFPGPRVPLFPRGTRGTPSDFFFL